MALNDLAGKRLLTSETSETFAGVAGADVQPSIISAKFVCWYGNLGLYNGLYWLFSITADWENPDNVTRLKFFQVFSSFIGLVFACLRRASCLHSCKALV